MRVRLRCKRRQANGQRCDFVASGATKDEAEAILAHHESVVHR